ncbi:MAG: recombination regulator RecX [Sulfuritalea sp.]|nr:recombination regulator RecX [Sulfuritalea sp.]
MSDLTRRAVSLLARREYSRAELARKLAPLATPDEIETVLDELARAGLQSDARFAESYFRSQAARLGVARLRQTLRQKGVAAELIDERIARLSNELPDELERARAVWQKKFAAAPVDRGDWARQARFLQGRGFSVEVIRKLLKDPEA